MLERKYKIHKLDLGAGLVDDKVVELDEKLDKHEKLIKGHDLEIKVMRKVE